VKVSEGDAGPSRKPANPGVPRYTSKLAAAIEANRIALHDASVSFTSLL
jgi:hypothetical protein